MFIFIATVKILLFIYYVFYLIFVICVCVFAGVGCRVYALHMLQASSSSKEAKSEETILQINVSLLYTPSA